MKRFMYVEDSNDNSHQIFNILGVKIKRKKKVNKKELNLYLDYVLNNQLDKSNFVKPIQEVHQFKENDVKIISFYLPQFHDFEENIKWFGRGFSEWSNTSKTLPQYIGHWQPHIPIDVGYYNLTGTEIIERQISLAKQYGIYGWAFYYYWYSGKKIMEKPIENFLADKSLDMPFFLFWANEDWTMLWDNGEFQETLHRQALLQGDAEKFMNDILPYMKDDRYIKIGNKPLLVIYELKKYPYEKYIDFNKKIREIAKQNGFSDLYIMTTVREWMDNTNLKEITDKYNLDSMLEFSPQGITHILERKNKTFMNPKFKGFCLDIGKYIKEKKYIFNSNTKLFKGCFPNWDNTPRRCYNGSQIIENTPQNYKIWLKDIINWTKNNKLQDEQYVFINAWNEWAEGAHLEPDTRYGYAYLRATKEALEDSI